MIEGGKMGWISWAIALSWGLFHVILGIPFTIFELYMACAWINLLFLVYSIYRLIKDRKKVDSDPWGFAFLFRIINTVVAFGLFYFVNPVLLAVGTPLFTLMVLYSIIMGYF
jgi:hypothetical protein